MGSKMVDHGLSYTAARDEAARRNAEAIVDATAYRYNALAWGGAYAVVRRDVTDAERAHLLAGVLTTSAEA